MSFVVSECVHACVPRLPWRGERCVPGIWRRSTGPRRWSPGPRLSGLWCLLRRTAVRTGTPQCNRTGRSEDTQRDVANTQRQELYTKPNNTVSDRERDHYDTPSQTALWCELKVSHLVKRRCANLKCVSVPPVLRQMSSCPVCESCKCVTLFPSVFLPVLNWQLLM